MNTKTSVDDLIKVLQELIADVTSMQTADPAEKNWFGPFSEHEFNDEGTHAIVEWPNLAISVDKAEALLKDYQPSELRGTRLSIMILDDVMTL